MASHSTASPAATHLGVTTQHVYILAGACLLVGLFLGYFLLGRHAAPTVGGAQTDPSFQAFYGRAPQADPGTDEANGGCASFGTD